MHDSEITEPTTTSEPDTSTDRPADPCVWRETTIDATPEEIWELLDSEEGRERWLEPDPERHIEVETEIAPERVVWRWQTTGHEDHRVEVILVPEPAQTRVIVIESEPRQPFVSQPPVPLASLAAMATSIHAHSLDRRWTLALA